jgi:hypothetical protein
MHRSAEPNNSRAEALGATARPAALGLSGQNRAGVATPQQLGRLSSVGVPKSLTCDKRSSPHLGADVHRAIDRRPRIHPVPVLPRPRLAADRRLAAAAVQAEAPVSVAAARSSAAAVTGLVATRAVFPEERVVSDPERPFSQNANLRQVDPSAALPKKKRRR